MDSLWQSLTDAPPDYYDESPWFPNPLICARNIAITGTKEAFQRLPWNGVGQWVNETIGWLSQSNFNDPSVIYVPLLMAFMLTLLRYFLNLLVFKPISKWCKLTEEAASKFPESIWKVGVYSVTWLWCIYITTSGPENYFFNLRCHFDVWVPDQPVKPVIYWLYMVEMGFYLHCCYATVYLETIRKDFTLMMTHHTVTLGLLMFSHIVRFHMLGLLLLTLLDIGDVLLETSKCFFYFKDRGHKKHAFPEIMANVCFGAFTLEHMVSRLYWFLTKVLYSGIHLSTFVYPGGPYYLFLNPLLLGLYAMQLYWFKFILQLLWKIVVLREVLEDNRDFKEENQNEPHNKDLRNGTKKHN